MALCKIDKGARQANAGPKIHEIRKSNARSPMLYKLAAAACLMNVTACATTGAETADTGTEAFTSLVAEGRTLANLKCGGCHALDRSDFSANWEAPPMKRLLPHLEFKMLERDRGRDAIMTHGQMPPLQLSMLDKEALVAYLQSIADPP
jgi:mono/diheme cytochrome c family protein